MSDVIANFQVPPVEKSVLVPCAPTRAFQAFTAEIGQWWPIKTHSVGQAKARSIILETRLGGRVFEIGADGGECEWGRILEWAPPQRFTMTWHPGRTAAGEQVVELSFIAEGDATRVTLLHRGWENLGAKAQTMRDSYDGGWDIVLARHFVGFFAPRG